MWFSLLCCRGHAEDIPFHGEEVEHPQDSWATGPSFLSRGDVLSIQSLTANFTASNTLFERLSPYIVHGAAHNSHERCDAPKCREETRVAIREDIISWIKHGDGDDEPKKIMWLQGPAGAGKTAIAGSVAAACMESGLLAASFFFSSFSPTANRRSKRGFVATLAFHMSQSDALHLYKAQLLTAIEEIPDIFHKDLMAQAECLILGPFRSIHGQGPREGWPKVVIIDGLDEVAAAQEDYPSNQQIPHAGEDDQVEILNVLLTLCQAPSFPFRIFISSRPEHNIAKFFATKARASAIDLFLDSKYNPDADIRRFLEAKFANIRRHAGISSPSWPGQPDLDRLVDMSSGQFVVPATIIRWVEAGVPQSQLAEVLQSEQLNTGLKNPFSTLDALYRHILQRACNPEDDPHLVVKWILCITSAMNTFATDAPTSAQFWRHFLENVEGELSYRLAPIASLIYVPPPDSTPTPITIYHESLSDFLSSPTRCGDLYVTKTAYNSFIADRIVIILRGAGSAPLLHPPTKHLFEFLRYFCNLKLLAPHGPIPPPIPGTQVLENHSKFLFHLTESSKAELALCDVASWTNVLLTRTIFGDGSSYGFSPDDRGIELLGSIYCRIHKAMECGSNTSASTRRTGTRGTDSRCHMACIHWRMGILARAKELKWCAHELEEVDLDLLHHMTLEGLKQKFRRAGLDFPCAICQPKESST